MSNFSVLVRLQNATQKLLDALLAGLDAQTEPSWELVLVSSQTRALDRQLAADFAAAHPKVRAITVADDIGVELASNLVEDLGTWTGFMEQDARLQPTCLAELSLAIAAHPSAKVVYTDEEARNRWDLVSARFDKGAINPLRLRSQEYLRHFTVIETAWLREVGGFDRMASQVPTHDFYLRTLEARGAAAFVNVPNRLYQRFRDMRVTQQEPWRRRDHMVDFDLWGIRQSLLRQEIPARVDDRTGTPEIRYAFDRRPHVTVITTQDPGILEGIDAYRPMTIVRVGSIAEFNAAATRADSELVCFLDAVPMGRGWLHRMVDHAMLAGVAAVGARLVDGFRLHQPGLVNWRFAGFDWNSRGRFNLLAVPHQVSAVSHAAMLVDLREFLAMGGFNAGLPTTFAMDYCLRADALGRASIYVPDAILSVAAGPVAAEAELVHLRSLHPGWVCRFGLHQPI